MSLGVHFALTKPEVEHLISLASDEARLDHLQEDIEESYLDEFREFTADTDKAWDAIHRALTDGALTWTNGTYPLNHAILAGESLYTGDDYIMNLKTPAQVQDIAKAMEAITAAHFRERYFSINPDLYDQPLSEEDFDYTWDGFRTLLNFYQHAASTGRFVLFTADQ